MIKTKIKELIKIVNELKAEYPQKHFTLDGRLVGDLGEIIAEENYELTLYDTVKKDYDAIGNLDSKLIQIKTTMKKAITYPKNFHPERLLAISLDEDGNFKELYNGETKPLIEYIESRTKNPDYKHLMITIGKLISLNKLVDERTRVRKKTLHNTVYSS